MTKLKLEGMLQGGQLSALPQSAIQILELSKDPNNGPAEFAAPIESDPGLAGQVLRFVNSSYFGFSREIASVKLAITLVGIRTIKNFTLWSAVFSLMPNPQCGPFDLKSLWQDSLRRGLFARLFAQSLGQKDAEEAFMAALLQDMAVPVLAKSFPQEYAQLLEERQGGIQRLSELEQERFGWTHADAASQLAEIWHLPEALGNLMESHIAIDTIASDPQAKPNQLAVSLSSLLPASVDEQWFERGQFEQYFNQVRSAKSPSPAELLGQVDESFDEFATLFKMSTPTRLLLDIYNEATVAS